MEVGVSKFMDNNDEILEITKDYVNYYNDFDDPIPYKGLFFYPVNCGNYKMFHNLVTCIMVNKKEISLKKVIRMSYLDFIIWASELEECEYPQLKKYNYKSFTLFLLHLLSMCLDIEPQQISTTELEGRTHLKLPVKKGDTIDYKLFDEKDFENFRKIICYQNDIEMAEEVEFKDPKVKEALDEALKFKNKHSNTCDFDEQVMVMMIILGETDKQKIKNITIKTFNKLLKRFNQIITYKSYLNGCSFEEKIDHWLDDLNKDKYDDVVMSYDNVESQLKGK